MKVSNFVCDLCGSHKSDVKQKLSLSIGVDTNKYNVVSCQICSLHTLYPLPSESEFKVIYENYAKRGNRIDVEKNRIETIYPKKIRSINTNLRKTLKYSILGLGLVVLFQLQRMKDLV